MSGPELQFLAEIANRSNNILEVGSYKGRSTRALADNTNGKVNVVDPWDGKYQYYADKNCINKARGAYHENGNNEVYADFCINLYSHINNGKVIINRMNFNEFKTNEKFDFIFIDAIHEYEALKGDIAHALTMMDKGILAGHDYMIAWPGVVKAVDEIFPLAPKHETIWYVTI